MTPRAEVLEIVVDDMASSLAFYRQLGLDIPEGSDGESHVEADLGGGLRMAWDTAAMIAGIDPAWSKPT